LTAVLDHPTALDVTPAARVRLLRQALVVLADEDRELTVDYTLARRMPAATEWTAEITAARAELRSLQRQVRDQLADLGADNAGGEHR
jgi:hypothetical protein